MSKLSTQLKASLISDKSIDPRDARLKSEPFYERDKTSAYEIASPALVLLSPPSRQLPSNPLSPPLQGNETKIPMSLNDQSQYLASSFCGVSFLPSAFSYSTNLIRIFTSDGSFKTLKLNSYADASLEEILASCAKAFKKTNESHIGFLSLAEVMGNAGVLSNEWFAEQPKILHVSCLRKRRE